MSDVVDRPASVRSGLRIFLVGGLIAYRALFNWIRPSIYIPTMLGFPLFQILFFSYLGRFAGVQDDTFFVVGNAMQSCAMAGVFGGTMAIANERWMQTLGALLATPAGRLSLFMGRALPYVANGMLVTAFGFAAGALLLRFDPAPSAILPLVVPVVVTVASCTGFGLLLGSIGLRARDVFFVGNVAYLLMLLLCGVNVPVQALPGPLALIARGLPLTNGIEAARAVLRGASLAAVWDRILAEAAVGVVYAASAFLLFRFLEADSRRSGALDRL